MYRSCKSPGARISFMLSQISRPFRDSARLGLVPKGSVHSSWLSECNLTGRKETSRSRTVCFVSLCVHRLDLPSDCITINHAKSAGKSAVDFEEECSCLDHFGVHRSLTYPPPPAPFRSHPAHISVIQKVHHVKREQGVTAGSKACHIQCVT